MSEEFRLSLPEGYKQIYAAIKLQNPNLADESVHQITNNTFSNLAKRMNDGYSLAVAKVDFNNNVVDLRVIRTSPKNQFID